VKRYKNRHGSFDNSMNKRVMIVLKTTNMRIWHKNLADRPIVK